VLHTACELCLKKSKKLKFITMKSTYIKYLVLCIALTVLTEITKSVLNFDQLMYNALAENLTSQQIENFLDLQSQWKWLSYVFIPVYILIKTGLIASVVYIGVFFFNKTEISFKIIFDKVIKAEFIFLLVPIFKIIWFYTFQTAYTLQDFQNFFPLSALNILGTDGIDVWFLYPLQAINLFEMAYVVYLGYQLGYVTKTTPDNGLKIMTYSYLPSMLLWIAVVMFFTLNYS
jgi:hypothetical protein